MQPTRREAGALVAAVMTRAIRAQSGSTELALVNPLGLRVTPHGDPNFPTLAVSLPNAGNAVLIEMPEHAWRRAQPNQEQSWFYRMYGSDKRYQGSATWVSQGA